MSDKRQIEVQGVKIGDGLPPLAIAEIGLNHNGSLKLAHELIDISARSGASIVKFQKRSPADLATASFLDKPFEKCPQFGSTQRKVRERHELSFSDFKELKQHADSLGVMFATSAFDLPSFEFAMKVGVPFIKVASHSITNVPYLKAIAETKIPVVASLGASTWQEKDQAYEILQHSPVVLLHCVSAYPCHDGLCKIDTITELRKRYRCPIGYSGHEAGFNISLAAVSLGACLVEKHITMNKSMMGLDHAISLEPQEFANMVMGFKQIAAARGVVPGLMPEESAARTQYHVSIVAKRAIKKGELIQSDMILFKQPLGQPGENFLSYEQSLVIGKKAGVDLLADEPIPRKALE